MFSNYLSIIYPTFYPLFLKGTFELLSTLSSVLSLNTLSIVSLQKCIQQTSFRLRRNFRPGSHDCAGGPGDDEGDHMDDRHLQSLHCCPGERLFTSNILKTSQELRMLSSVTINCHVTKIVINPGSQLSVL